jgi:SAM-dependent methyltransferase
MDFYKETFDTWDKLASPYQDKFMDLEIYDETYDLFCKMVAADNAPILDLGCGPGNISKYLQSKRADFRIDGVDVAPNMIALAQANIPTGCFRVMDCRDIRNLNTSYHGIICGFCLPYLTPTDAANLIADCYQLLEEGGWFYLSFVEGDPAQSGFISGSSGDRTYFHYYRTTDLQKQLLEQGFLNPLILSVNYKRSENQSELHIILLCRKKPATD